MVRLRKALISNLVFLIMVNDQVRLRVRFGIGVRVRVRMRSIFSEGYGEDRVRTRDRVVRSDIHPSTLN